MRYTLHSHLIPTHTHNIKLRTISKLYKISSPYYLPFCWWMISIYCYSTTRRDVRWRMTLPVRQRHYHRLWLSNVEFTLLLLPSINIMPTHGLLWRYLPRWSTFAHSMFLYLLRAFDLLSTFIWSSSFLRSRYRSETVEEIEVYPAPIV